MESDGARGWRATARPGANRRRLLADLLACIGVVGLAAATAWLCNGDPGRTAATAGAIAALIGLVAWLFHRVAATQATLRALQDSEQRFRDYTETASDWYWETDPEHRFVTRLAQEQTFGADLVNPLGKTRRELAVDVEAEPEKWRRHEETLARRAPFHDFVYRFIRYDGVERFVSASGKPMFGADGTFLGYRGSGRDVTEAAQASRAILAAKQAAEAAERDAAAARARLAAAIEIMPEGFVLFDPDDRLVICNDLFRSLYPRSGHRLVPGMRFEDMLRMGAGGGEFRHATGRVEEWIAERMAWHAKPMAEFEQHTADGRWIRVQERRLPDGSSVGLRIDVTEWKQREAAFRLGEERFRDFAQTSSDWYWEQDAELRFTYFSDVSNKPRRFQELLGKTRDAAIENGVAPELFARHMAELAARRPFRDFRYQRVNPDGEVRHISISGLPLFDADGNFRGYRGTGRDVTAEVRAAEDLRHAKEEAEAASRTKSQFLANMSHELRTPLNAILGFSEVIRDMMMGPVDERYREYASDIHRAGRHLLSLIGDVLDLSKIEVGRLELHEEQVRLAEVFDSCRRLVAERAREQGVTLELAPAGELPPVRADRLRLKQILLNLLSNAVKFTEPGGRVVLGARLEPTGELALSVADSGIGMRPEDIPMAMAPFGQVDGALSRRYEGTGLGLPLAKTLAELHGGRLAIDSKPGRGTVVTVTLPAARIQRAAA